MWPDRASWSAKSDDWSNSFGNLTARARTASLDNGLQRVPMIYASAAELAGVGSDGIEVERKPIGVLDGLDRKIDIEVRP